MWWRSQSGIIHVVSIAAFTSFLIKLFTLDFVFIGFVRKSPHTKKKGSLPCRFVALNWTMTVSPYLTLIAPSVNRKEHTNVSLRRTLAIYIDQLNKCTNSHWYNIIHVFHSSREKNEKDVILKKRVFFICGETQTCSTKMMIRMERLPFLECYINYHQERIMRESWGVGRDMWISVK